MASRFRSPNWQRPAGPACQSLPAGCHPFPAARYLHLVRALAMTTDNTNGLGRVGFLLISKG